MSQVPLELRPILAEIWNDGVIDPLVLRAACRLGSRDAYERLLKLIEDKHLPHSTQIELLGILDEMGSADCVGPVLAVLRESHDEALESAALSTLGRFDQPQIAQAVLSLYPKMSVPVRTVARGILFGRPDWVRKLLASIDARRDSRNRHSD